MKKKTTFTVTELHIKLIREMYVGWQDCETGAPEIDPKRPYGNSDVAGDVAEILGLYPKNDEGDRRMTADQENELLAIHRETETALQIVLVTGEFKPGRFQLTEEYQSRSWKKID